MRKREWIKDNLEIIFAVGMISTVVITLFLALAFGIKNESNRITEGTVVDKEYSSEYTNITYHKSGNTQIPQVIHHPEKYELKIQGQKDGETVTYWFECTADEYQRYSVGDYYKK